ncbi:MAG: DUF4835 family protein [Rhizobacter sp.]|nr:DUF4835 family protein [Chlorobiales bacterium]
MKVIFFFCLFCVLARASDAQELECNVRANLERIPSDSRLKLRGSGSTSFEQIVQNYLNNHRWTTEDFGEEDRVVCDIEFIFLSADIVQSPAQYTAQMVVSSRRPVYRSLKPTLAFRTLDANVSFSFDERQLSLPHNEDIYGPLTSLLDYYALVILGTDFDTFSKQGGTPYFDRANRIARRAQTLGTFKTGWQTSDAAGINRAVLIDELLDPRYAPVRDVFFQYHYDGLDEFYRDPVKSRGQITLCIEKIGEIDTRYPRSSIIRRVFESKYIEIGELFKVAPLEERKRTYDLLLKVDPSHKQSYDTYITLTP